MSPNAELPNMTRLRNGVYIVRTQAGFRKALREFRETHADLEYDREKPRYPIEYPVMVFFSTFYCGHEKLDVEMIHLSELRKTLAVVDPRI